MTDGNEDILENWEEIDEAGLTNTLRKIEADRRSKEEEIGGNFKSKETITTGSEGIKLLKRSDKAVIPAAADSKASPLDNMATTFQPVLKVLHKDENEYDSANYAQPIAMQTVKILRRPTQSTESRDNGMRPRQPIKSLQQREQEYAEARLRILGSAKNPEDEAPPTTSAAGTTSASPSTGNVSSTAGFPTTSVGCTATMPSPVLSASAASTCRSNNYEPRMFGPPTANPVAYNHQFATQQQYQNVQGLPYQKKPLQHLYQPQHPQQMQQQQQQQRSHMLPQSPAYNNNNNRPPLIKSPPILSHSPMPPQHTLHGMLGAQYHHQISAQAWSPMGNSASVNPLRQNQQQHHYPDHTQVLRTPRGPDGSMGFGFRR